MKYEDIQVGMKFVFDPRVVDNSFRSRKGGFNAGYVDNFMDALAGRIVTVTSKLVLDTVKIFEDNGRYSYDTNYFLTEEECKKLGLEIVDNFEKDTERTYTDFKQGDLVKFRDIETIKKYYLVTKDIINTTHKFHLNSYEEIKNENAIISQVEDFRNEFGSKGVIALVRTEAKENKQFWIDTNLLEIVEENYLEKKKERVKEDFKKMCKKLEATDEIVDEMISKVDVAKFKKILASATAKRGSSFKGIDKLIRNWANSKKDIYLLLGRNLKLTKEIEYEANIDDFKLDLFELFKQFPRTSIVI